MKFCPFVAVFDLMSFDPRSFDNMSVNLTKGSLETLLTVPVRKFTNLQGVPRNMGIQ